MSHITRGRPTLTAISIPHHRPNTRPNRSPREAKHGLKHELKDTHLFPSSLDKPQLHHRESMLRHMRQGNRTTSRKHSRTEGNVQPSDHTNQQPNCSFAPSEILGAQTAHTTPFVPTNKSLVRAPGQGTCVRGIPGTKDLTGVHETRMPSSATRAKITTSVGPRTT